jgi:hypothetical protein
LHSLDTIALHCTSHVVRRVCLDDIINNHQNEASSSAHLSDMANFIRAEGTIVGKRAIVCGVRCRYVQSDLGPTVEHLACLLGARLEFGI